MLLGHFDLSGLHACTPTPTPPTHTHTHTHTHADSIMFYDKACSPPNLNGIAQRQ